MTNKPVAIKKVAKEETEPSRIDSFIEKALAGDASPETLERLFALHERIEARRAQTSFIQALAEFQSECPAIKKTKKVTNQDGSVRYMYAPLDSIIEQTGKLLTKHGFSYRWDTEDKEGKVTAICIATHRDGHSERSEFTVEIGAAQTNKYGKELMTSPQRHASALTFAKRYSFCDVFGIATADEDTDATDVDNSKGAISAKSKIIFNLKRLGYETSDKVVIEEKIKEITGLKLVDKNFDEIVSRLETTVKEREEYDENNQV